MATPKGGTSQTDLAARASVFAAATSAAMGQSYVIRANQWDGWFGGGTPLNPVAPKGEVEGRPFDFPFAINVNTRPRSEGSETGVSFPLMRQLAEPGQGGLDLLRLAIETRKDQMAAQRWQIQARDDNDDGGPTARAIEAIFKRPDGIHSFDQWIRMILEDHMVIDSVCVYPRGIGSSRPVLDLIDGSTIKILVDANGRTPLPPLPAYQQNLHGMPAVDYRWDELLLYVYNVRTNRLYGQSRTEQVINVVNLALRRQLHILQYYTEGNVPEALISVPTDWNPDQIKAFQVYWDAYLAGDTAQRRHAKFVPGGMTVAQTKEDALKNEFDEWLARIICYAFSLPPLALVKQQNRATAEIQKTASQEEGLEPMKLYAKAIFDDLLARVFKRPDLEWSWIDEEITNALTKAQVVQIYVGMKPVMTVNEGREMIGLPALSDAELVALAPPVPVVAPLSPDGKPTLPQPNGNGKGGTETKADHPTAVAAKARKASSGGRVLRPGNDPVHTEQTATRIRSAVQSALGTIRDHLLVHLHGGKVAKVDEPARLVNAIPPEVWRQLSATLQTALAGLATSQAADAVRAAIDASGSEATDAEIAGMLDVANENAVAWAAERAGELITSISETTRDGVRDIVRQAIADGASNTALADLLSTAYEFSGDRAEMIARTETAYAEASGTLDGWMASGVVEGKVWLADAEACDECLPLDGEEVGLDESFSSGDDAPPLHPNCCLPETLVAASGNVSAYFRRWFEGEIIRITIDTGRCLSVTPNHPILTPGGWVPAGELRKGDDVLYAPLPLVAMRAGHPEHDHMETRIDELTDAALVARGMTAVSVPVSPEDFHGDGVVNHEVCIVRPNGKLWPRTHVTAMEREAHPAFSRSIAGEETAGLGDLLAMGSGVELPAHSVMGGGRPEGTGYVRSAARLDDVGFAHRPHGEGEFPEPMTDCDGVTTDLPREIDARLAPHVSTVKITSADRVEHWSGHVYNLETEDGWYFADSIIVHNCRCSMTATLMDPAEAEASLS